MSFPSETEAWVLENQTGVAGLHLHKDVKLPSLGPHDVLVRIRAASLNFRELVVAQVGKKTNEECKSKSIHICTRAVRGSSVNLS